MRFRIHLPIHFVFAQLIFAVHLVAGSVYYVAPDGDDSNPGSSGAPYRTLARGVQVAGAGDTVMVRDGTYGHESAWTSGDDSYAEASPVVLKNSGDPSAWITIQAEHKWGAILDCQMMCDAYINLANASYVVIRDFVITRGYKEGIHSNDAAHHITILGNRIEFIANRDSITRFGLDGMYTNPNCHDFIIDGNVFHDIGRTNPSQLDHGLYLRGWNYSITNNVFYGISHGWAIQAADGLTNVVLANNTFVSGITSSRGGQIMLWNSQSNLIVRNNIFYNATNYAIARFRSTPTNCAIDHNLVYGAYDVLPDFSGCIVDMNQNGADPLFVNGTTPPFDFHLRPGSPAIGAGAFVPGLPADLEGTARPGSGLDLGAYAFKP